MSFFKKYRTYLADNPEAYWFKRKAYGWGWVPATREGWLSLALFLAVFVWIYAPFISDTDITAEDAMHFLIHISAWTLALLLVCYMTGEKLRWQWGIPEKN